MKKGPEPSYQEYKEMPLENKGGIVSAWFPMVHCSVFGNKL